MKAPSERPGLRGWVPPWLSSAGTSWPVGSPFPQGQTGTVFKMGHHTIAGNP